MGSVGTSGKSTSNGSRFVVGRDYPENSNYYKRLVNNFDREVQDRASYVERRDGTSVELNKATNAELDFAIKSFEEPGGYAYKIDSEFQKEVLKIYKEERRKRGGK